MMTQMSRLEVRKDNLGESRLVTGTAPALKEGEILVRVERFALTANNVTYGVVGEKIGYWKFFPAEEGWGVIPVWGFAEIVESQTEGLGPGDRLYGYFPMGTHLVMTPVKVSAERLIDGAPHRAELPPVYNSYSRAGVATPLDDARALLFPLYATSFCLYDFLIDNDWFGAAQAVLVSASSKTAIGLAIALHDDERGPAPVALTSPRNLQFVKDLGLYDAAFTYEEISAIDNSKPTVVVDFSGNGETLSDLHRHLGDNMRFCSNVGVTHYEKNAMGPHFIHERSQMFFAPGHIKKRAGEWGPGAFEQKAFGFWKDAAEKRSGWLKIEHAKGMNDCEDVFHELRKGGTAPDRGLIVEPWTS
ncbi:MAG: DUF2855 family protein [Parvularculaceae bacterium]